MSTQYKQILDGFSPSLPASLATARAPAAAPLAGWLGVSLETCETENEPYVAKWLQDPRLVPLWGEYRVPIHAGAMEQMNVLRARAIFLLVRKRGEPEPLGFVCAKTAPPPRRHMSAGIFLDDRYRGFGYGAVAFAVLLRYLFQSFDVPQLVFEVYGWDRSGFRAMAHFKEFRLEGVRPEHFQMDGALYDLYELALSREDFESLNQTALLEKLLGGGESTH